MPPDDPIGPLPQVRNPGGQPPKIVDLAIVERAASIGCTANEIAAMCGFSRSTWFNKLHDDPAVREAVERGKDRGCATLRRLQWKGAQGGNPTMLIWLGKQMLGQRDLVVQEINGTLQVEDTREPVESLLMRMLPKGRTLDA